MFKNSVLAAILALTLTSTPTHITSNYAHAQIAGEDDCAIWLCLPLGFAAPGCGPARRAFLRRVPFRPPLPAFPLCVVPGTNSSIGTFTEGREEFESCGEGFEPTFIPDQSISRNVLEIIEPGLEGDGQLVCARPESCTNRFNGTATYCSEAFTPARRTDQEFVEVFIDGESQGRYYYSIP